MKKFSPTAPKNYVTIAKTLLRKMYAWLLFLALVWFTWLLAKMVWLVIAPPVAPALQPLPLIANQQTQNINHQALDIFAQPQPQVQQLPPPDVKIVGVTVASNPLFSFAMLNSNNKIRSYRVGDLIDNTSYQLAEVKTDHILLKDMHGQTIKIEFGTPFELDQSSDNRAKNPQNPVLNNQTLTNIAVPPPIGQHGQVTPDLRGFQPPSPIPPQSPTSDNSPLNEAITNFEQNPANFLTQMGVTTSGQGYTVTDNMPAGIKDRLGLQNGDKVISVNGQSVGQNPAQDAQVLREVQQSGQAQIQIQRGNQVVTIRQSF